MDRLKDEYIKNCTLIGQFKFLNRILDLFWLLPIIIMYIYLVIFYNVDDPPVLVILLFLLIMPFSAVIMYSILHRKITTYYNIKLQFCELNNQIIQQKLENNFLNLIDKYGLTNKEKLKKYIEKAEHMSESKRYDWIPDKALASSIFLPIWIGFVNSSFKSIIYEINHIFSFLLALGTIVFISIFFVKKTTFEFIQDYTNCDSKIYEQLAYKLEEYRWEHL
jgi:hypothetical protein